MGLSTLKEAENSSRAYVKKEEKKFTEVFNGIKHTHGQAAAQHFLKTGFTPS